MVMVMVMEMVMEMAEVGDLPLEEVGMVEAMVMVMEMEEVTLLHPLIQDSHDTADALKR